jgi:hypothetical protein
MALVATAPSTISGRKNRTEGLDDLDLPSNIGGDTCGAAFLVTNACKRIRRLHSGMHYRGTGGTGWRSRCGYLACPPVSAAPGGQAAGNE